MYADDDLLMLSGLQHISYCERQWALIHLEQQWDTSVDTARGDIFHEKVHREGLSASGNMWSQRGLHLVSHHLGLVGIADVVEFIQDNKGSYIKKGSRYAVVPVEYKVGKPKIEDWDRLQVCAQALCLEEMLECNVHEAALFYGKTRRRERIELSEDLKIRVELLSKRMHELFDSGITPAVNKTSKCSKCSLQDICMPGVSSKSAVAYWSAAY